MKLGLLLTTLVLAIMLAIIGTLGYYISYRTDCRMCPWAYSLDEKKPLLVGKWAGTFIEPDSVEKQISLEIYEPYTTKERLFNSIGLPFSQKLRNYNKFDGLLIIESKRKKESFKIRGRVNTKNTQLFDFHFLANENKNGAVPYYYSFIINDGFWKANDMSFILNVIFNNNSYTRKLKILDYQLNKKVKVALSRIKA